MSQRLDKLEGHYQRERQILIGLRKLTEPLWQTTTPEKLAADSSNAVLEEYRWLLEEYRVSLYAQGLGTRAPVSEKRLKALWRDYEQSRAARV